MVDIVTEITNIGHIECSQGHTAQPLYVTITNGDNNKPPYPTVRLLTEQSTEQEWCLVRTNSMQEDCFIICSHPSMDRVLVATQHVVEGYDKAKYIKVEKLTRPIVKGQPLPKPLNELYRFRMDPEKNGGFYFYSLSNVFADPVMQGGYHDHEVSTGVPNINDFVTLHNRQKTIRELFCPETPPRRR